MPIEPVDLAAARAAMSREADLFSLPEAFIENTKLRAHAAAAALDHAHRVGTDPRELQVLQQSCKSYPAATQVVLPAPAPVPDAAAFDCLVRRTRVQPPGGMPAAAAAPLPLNALSRLLFYGYGVVDAAAAAVGGIRPRTTPSAGGAYPLELYAVARRVEETDSGVYHYNAFRHRLERLDGSASRRDGWLATCFAAGSVGPAAPAILVLTAIPLRSTYLYGERGYRRVLVEAGRAAQNLHLGGLSVGVQVVESLDFLDDPVHRLLGVDGVDEIAVGVFLAGGG